MVKNLPASEGDAGDMGLIPTSRRSPGAGNENPLEYSCLGNFMDRGAWRTISPWGYKESDMTMTKPSQKSFLQMIPQRNLLSCSV